MLDGCKLRTAIPSCGYVMNRAGGFASFGSAARLQPSLFIGSSFHWLWFKSELTQDHTALH